jgi:hypothetical protein
VIPLILEQRMKQSYGFLATLAALGLAGAAACNHEVMPTGAAGAVRAVVALHAGTVASTGPSGSDWFGGGADTGWVRDTLKMGGDDWDRHGRFFFGRIHRADIDSLTLDVTKVEVLQVNPDSENAADSAAEAAADSGKGWHEDGDDRDDHENDERTWVALDVTAGGHLNLLSLPESASAGLTIATGTLPPGTYRHVRLFATKPMIFLKNQIVTPTGDTLKAGVGIPVLIPSADSTGALIKTDERFTLTSGSTSVQLFFDEDDSIRGVVLTGNGKILLRPVIH